MESTLEVRRSNFQLILFWSRPTRASFKQLHPTYTHRDRYTLLPVLWNLMRWYLQTNIQTASNQRLRYYRLWCIVNVRNVFFVGLKPVDSHTQHHAESTTTQPKHGWSQRADGALKRQHRQNFCLLCGRIRATSGCVSTNAQQIPQVRQTLADGGGASKCWSTAVCYVHLLEQPENINHGLSLRGAPCCSLTSRKCCVLLGESEPTACFLRFTCPDSKIGKKKIGDNTVLMTAL